MSLKWKLPWYSGLQLSPDYWGGGREIALRLCQIKCYLDSLRTDKAQQREVGGDFINRMIQVRLPFNLIGQMLQRCRGQRSKNQKLKQNGLIALPYTGIFKNESGNRKDCITEILNPWLLQANTATNLHGKSVQVERNAILALLQMGRGMGSLGQAAFEFFLPDVILKRCAAEHSDPEDMDWDQTECVVLLFCCSGGPVTWGPTRWLAEMMQLTNRSYSPPTMTYHPGHIKCRTWSGLWYPADSGTSGVWNPAQPPPSHTTSGKLVSGSFRFIISKIEWIIIISSVFIIYCCLTYYPQLSSLKS